MKDKEVEIFSSEDCAPCEKAKEFFDERGIPYVEKKIEKEKNMEAVKSYLGDGGEGMTMFAIPVICFNGSEACTIGFSEEELKEKIAD